MNDNDQEAADAEKRIIAEFVRYTGRKNVRMSIEPCTGENLPPHLKGSYVIWFKYDGKKHFHDVMGFKPGDPCPVWDIYGRPSQYFIRNEALLQDFVSLVRGIVAPVEVSIVAFYDDEGKVLLEDRCKKSRFGEEWAFFGGGLEEGETKEDAAKREIWEELGYRLDDFRHVKTYSGRIGDAETVEHLFAARFPGWDCLKVSQGNGADLFSVDEMRNLKLMDTPHPMLDDIEALVRENNFSLLY
jgi:8-oxo-dGTP pyrophosphatase MutT (NUDIX family)